MSRDLSTNALADMFAQETGACYAVLLTIDHDDLTAPICVNNSGTAVISNGVTYLDFPFDITLPDDLSSASARAKLVIDNIDRQIVRAIRELTSEPVVTMQVIRTTAPDVIEANWTDFKLTNITYDVLHVSGDLTIEEFTSEPFPAQTFSPSLFPGIF